MTTLSVITYNVDGMNDDLKRKTIFTRFRSQRYDIIFLQETHIQAESIEKVKQEWGKKSYWNSGLSSSTGGTGTLILNDDVEMMNTKMDKTGRILNIEFKLMESTIQAINVYAPTIPGKREHFYETVEDYMFRTDHIIMSGDFNMVENPLIDRKPPSNNPQYRQGINALTDLKDKYTMEDKWRMQMPNAREYTWTSRKSGENIKSRLDRFYLSKGIILISQIVVSDIQSDHEILLAKIQIPGKTKRGRGYWKFNNSVLEDEEYIRIMSEKLEDNSKKSKTNLNQWWEETKIMIRQTTINFSRQKGNKRKRELDRLWKELDRTKDEQQKQKIEDRIKEIEMARDKGVLIRSREKTILNEDKPNAYFYIREDWKQTKDTIHELHTIGENDELLIHKTQIEIRKILYQHHKNLYGKREMDPEITKNFLVTIDLFLTEEQKEEMERPITKQELTNAILDMENNKSPGPDGISGEFYKTFLPLLQDDLLMIINNVYVNQRDQPQSQKLGYIKLVYKRGIKYFIINWRGITLLCIDHKIMTKVMATRLRKVLPSIVKEDQTCSVPDRSIFQNVYLIRDVIEHAKYKNQPTYIISYDFQNAFDSVDHGYVLETLRRYNFGPRYMNFIKTIYTGRKVQVMNNGELTLSIPLDRGFSQGDPSSLPLYCLTSEPMANSIRQHRQVKGYHIPGMKQETAISQYADDTNTILTRKESALAVHNVFQAYAWASGCNLHPEKTKGLSIMTDDIPTHPQNISWNEDTGLKILGIHFFVEQKQTIDFNWTKIIKKIEEKVDSQKLRSLSLKGKITILNTTILSKAWFLSTVYPAPKWAEKRITKSIFTFLWGDRGPELIKREIIYLPKEKGGLGLLHFNTQGKALRLKYLFQITQQNMMHKWIYFARYWTSTRLYKYDDDWRFLNNNLAPAYNGTCLPLHYFLLLQDFGKNQKDLMQLTRKTTKEIYITLKKKEDEAVKLPVQTTWQYTIRWKTIIWKKIWKHTFESFCVGKPNDVLYKVLHNCLPTKVRMKKNRKNTDNYDMTCKLCRTHDETTLHIFAKCQHAQEIWRKYQDIYQRLLPRTKFCYEEAALTVNLQDIKQPSPTSKLVLTITTIILYQLWNSRNKYEKEDIIPDIDRSITTINNNLKQIIVTHYRHNKLNNTLSTFIKGFCIKNILCSIDYHNSLDLFLPPLVKVSHRYSIEVGK